MATKIIDTFKVKRWFADKEQAKARSYSTWFDIAKRNSNDQPLVEDECIFLKGEKLQESEKAIKVTLETGECDGSVKGWTCWIPKSVMM